MKKPVYLKDALRIALTESRLSVKELTDKQVIALKEKLMRLAEIVQIEELSRIATAKEQVPSTQSTDVKSES